MCYNLAMDFMEVSHSKPNDGQGDNGAVVEGKSWENPGEFPEFAGDKAGHSNVNKLQDLLEKSGFSELRKDSEEFSDFLKYSDKEDMHRYLQHLNQNLREATRQERGFYENRMFAGGMISPNQKTQTEVLDETIDAIAEMENDKYRAALGYYQMNLLHLFPDANGRTSRTIYSILRRPDFDLKEQDEFITHMDNKSQDDGAGKKRSEFEEINGLSYPKEFTQYSMLETLKVMQREDAEMRDELEPFRQNFERMMEREPRYRANLVTVMGAGIGVEAGKELYSMKDNPAYKELSDEDRDRFNYALCDNEALVSVAGLAMLKFHQDKGDLREFIEKYTRENRALGGLEQCMINVDPDDEEYFGGRECKDWSAEDMMHYADIAEGIKKRQLEVGIDIFAHPEAHVASTGEKTADILAR